MIGLLFSALLLPARLFGAEVVAPPEEVEFQLPAFTQGLYTRYSSNAIPDNALAEATNVLLDEDVDGVVVRRSGYAKCNATAATGAKTFRGLWRFDSDDGQHYQIGLSSRTLFQHTGDCMWTEMTPSIYGLSSSLELECVQALGKFWCTNGLVGLWHDLDGSSATVSAMPVGTLIDTFRNRILVGDISAARSQLKMSGELDGEDWTINTLSTSPITLSIGGVNDGNKIKCLMGAYNDVYIIGKEDSLWGLYGFDRNDFAVRELSREVGCIDQRTVKEKNGCLYWLSKRGLEKMCGSKIDRASDPIRNILDSIITTAGNLRTAEDSSASDFAAGTLNVSGNPAPLSTTISPGDVTPTTWASYGFAGQWTLVDAASDTTNGVFISSRGMSGTWDGWTQLSGTTVTAVLEGVTYICAAYIGDMTFRETPSNVGQGEWRFTQRTINTDSGGQFSFRFIVDANGDYYSVRTSGANLYLSKTVSGVTTDLSTDGTFNTSLPTSYIVYRSSSGWMKVLYSNPEESGELVATDTDILGASEISIGLKYIADPPNSRQACVSAPLFVGYKTSGTVTSPIFDTGVSTPVGGNLSSTFTLATDTRVNFYVRSSTSPNNDVWGSWVSSSDTIRVTNQGRYWQARGILYTESSSRTATITDISLSASATGYFISQCRNPGTSLTSWNTFVCGVREDGAALSFAVSTGPTCHAVTRSTASWQTQTNNSVISVDTAPYVAYRVLFATGAYLQGCTISWNEGESRPPVASAVYNDRYYLAYTSSTASGAKNDHILVLDKNDKWTLFDNHYCYSLGLYDRKLYCGSSTDNGFSYLMDSGRDDDGGSFTSSVKTKSFSFGDPGRRKSYRKLSLELEPEGNESDDIDIAASYYLDRSTTAVSMGAADLGEDPGYLLWAEYPFPTDGSVASRWIQLQFSATGTNQPFRIFGGKLKMRANRED